MAHRSRRTSLAAVSAVLVLGACTEAIDTSPYIWPEPFYGEPMPDSFTIRYSDWMNTPDQVRAAIAEICGADELTARVFERPYQGTLLHPQALAVVCGDPPPPRPSFRGQSVDPGYLVQLRDLKPAPAPIPGPPAADGTAAPAADGTAAPGVGES